MPKAGTGAGEGDEGYLLVFVCAAKGSNTAAAAATPEPADGRIARLYVLDAKAEGLAAVAAFELPGAVPYGLHSCWMPMEDLA